MKDLVVDTLCLGTGDVWEVAKFQQYRHFPGSLGDLYIFIFLGSGGSSVSSLPDFEEVFTVALMI